MAEKLPELSHGRIKEANHCLLLAAGQVAEMLSLSKRTVFRLNSAGKMPKPVRINGSIRWRRSDIQRWLDWDCPERKMFESMRGDVACQRS